MKRGLMSQTLHTLSSMAGNQGLQIIAGIVISRIYGPAGKGVITYAGIAILGVVAIADGLAAAIARECAGRGERGPAAYAAALRIVTMVSLVAAFPLIVLGALVPSQQALLFVGLAFPFALFVQTMGAFYLVSHRIERANAASLVINAGAALAILLTALVVHPPITVIMGIWAGGYAVGAAIIFLGLSELRGGGVTGSAVRESLRAQLSFAVRSSSASLMTFLASRADVFIVAATLSAAALGNYTLALACGELMWQIGRAISWSACGRVAAAPVAEGARLTAKITRIVLAVECLVALAVIVAGPSLITLIYGPAFDAAGPVLRILVPGMALYAGDSILTYFLSVKIGRPGIIMRVETVTLGVCVAGSLATVGRYGMAGPAVATTCAYLVSFGVKTALFVQASGLKASSLLFLQRSDLRRNGSTGAAVA